MYIHLCSTKDRQMIRWQNMLNEYDFEVHHRLGEKMQHDDALSRAPIPVPDDVRAIPSMFAITCHEEEGLHHQQCDDQWIQEKIRALKKSQSERSVDDLSLVKDYELQDGILYKRDGEALKFVVTKAMRKSLAVRFHDLQGHFGMDRTLRKLKEFYYFPGMKD